METKKDKSTSFKSLYLKVQKAVYKQLEFNQESISNILIYLLIFVSIIITFLGLIPFFRHGVPKKILFYMNLVVGSIFLIEYFLRLWVCKLSPKYKKQGRFKYIFSPMPMIDFFASLPVVFLWADIFGIINASNFGFGRILRLARFLRAAKLGRLKKIQKQILDHPVIIGLIASLIFIFYSSVEVYYADQAAGNGTTADFWNFYRNLFIVFTGEYAFDAQSFSGKLYTLLVYITGLVFGGIVLGRLVSFFSDINKYEKVPDGLSDHIVIMNWTPVTDAIVRKLHDKVISGKREIVIITENKDINKEVLYLNSEYDFVYFLHASPLSAEGLEKANIAEAHSLILLYDANTANPVDFNVKILLAVKAILADSASDNDPSDLKCDSDNGLPHIICEMIDKKGGKLSHFNEAHLKKAGADEIISRNKMNNLLAQSALNPRIPDVFKEFLTVSDTTNEIYLKQLPAGHPLISGIKKFGSFFYSSSNLERPELKDDFDASFIPIGVIPEEENGFFKDRSGLNPSPSVPVTEDSKLILISYEEPVFSPDVQLRFKKALLTSLYSSLHIMKNFFQKYRLSGAVEDSHDDPHNIQYKTVFRSGDYFVVDSIENIKCFKKHLSEAKCSRCKKSTTTCEVVRQLLNGVNSSEKVCFLSVETYRQMLEISSSEDKSEKAVLHYYTFEKLSDETLNINEVNAGFEEISGIMKKSCFVLMMNESSEDPDAENAFIAMDLKAIFEVPRITVEIKHPENAAILKASGADTTICSTDYTNGIIALCAMEGGLFNIFNSLLTISDDTNEFYIYQVPDFKKILNKQFSQLQSEIYEASFNVGEPVILIGYISGGNNGRIIINPRNNHPESVLTEENVESLIFIAYGSPKEFLDQKIFT